MKCTIAAFALLFTAQVAGAQNYRPIVVVHSPSAPITTEYVSSVISKMNQLVEKAFGCEDIQFYRGSPPVASTEVPFTINTQSQTTGLFNADLGNVLVARFLSFCGRPDTGYAGCSANNKNALVEYMPNTTQAALLWLHEIGHSHTLGHVTDEDRLMYPIVSIGRDAITQSECEKYVAGNEKFPIFEAAIVAESDLRGSDVEQLLQIDLASDQVSMLKSILEGVWAGGTSEATSVLDPLFQEMPNFLSAIRQILIDDEQIHLWPNAVLALGIYGDESDILYLESFLRRKHPQSEYVVQSVANVPFSIGYLSGRYASENGLNILRQAAEIEAAGAFIEGDTDPETSPEALSGIAQNFAQESLTALARAEGEISRRSDRGEAPAEAALIAEGAFSTLTARIVAGDPPFPVEEGSEDDFVGMLNELRNDVQRLGLEAYVRADEF